MKNYDWIYSLQVEDWNGKFKITYPDGSLYSEKPYKTAAATKREITLLKKEAQRTEDINQLILKI